MYYEAIIQFSLALSLEPNAHKIRYYLATAYEEKGELDRAVEEFKKIPAEGDVFVDARIHLAFIYQKQGRIDDAAKVIKEAIDIKGADTEIYKLFASVYKEQ